MNHFHCDSPGLTTDEPILTQLAGGEWLAESKIGSIFGSEVEGFIRGVGPTKEAALAALAIDRSNLYESMWA
jgi:hypothetical protein